MFNFWKKNELIWDCTKKDCAKKYKRIDKITKDELLKLYDKCWNCWKKSFVEGKKIDKQVRLTRWTINNRVYNEWLKE